MLHVACCLVHMSSISMLHAVSYMLSWHAIGCMLSGFCVARCLPHVLFSTWHAIRCRFLVAVARCLLHAAFYVARCLLSVASCLFGMLYFAVACYPLLAVCFACCMLFVAYCMLRKVHNSHCCGMMFDACCLSDACFPCMLHVAFGSFRVAVEFSLICTFHAICFPSHCIRVSGPGAADPKWLIGCG